MVSMQIMAHPTSLSLKLKKKSTKRFHPSCHLTIFMTKCNGQRTFVARNQCNANEICADNIKFSVYEMVNIRTSKYVSKNIKK